MRLVILPRNPDDTVRLRPFDFREPPPEPKPAEWIGEFLRAYFWTIKVKHEWKP